MQSSAGTIPIRIVASAKSWCSAYLHSSGWRSHYGPHLICATCHPPAAQSLVAEWLQRDAAVDEPALYMLAASDPSAKPHPLLSSFAADVRRDRAAKQLRRERREAHR